jgi:hypothetical protein
MGENEKRCMIDTLASEGNTFNGVDFQVLFTLVRLFSTHRKSQITSWQQALSNIGLNESYRSKFPSWVLR